MQSKWRYGKMAAVSFRFEDYGAQNIILFIIAI